LFGDDDNRLYRDLLRETCDKPGAGVFRHWPDANRVHLILAPATGVFVELDFAGIWIAECCRP
jgi:hypothetical protein